MPDVSPSFFRDWVAVALFVLFVGDRIWSRISSKRVQMDPSPVQVQVQPTAVYATKEQHEDLADRMDRLEGKMERNFDELKKSRSEDIQNLHNHIDSSWGKLEVHVKDLVRLQQDATKTAFDRLDNVTAKVGRLEGRIEQKGGRGA